jgi:hypothetical protein
MSSCQLRPIDNEISNRDVPVLITLLSVRARN